MATGGAEVDSAEKGAREVEGGAAGLTTASIQAEEDRKEFESKLKDTPRASDQPKEDDLQKRFQAAQEQSKQRIEEMRVKDLEYKALMLAEVKEQTELLRAIREKLQA